MPYDSRSFAMPVCEAAAGPTLARRLISWITRRASPARAEDPADAPVSAQALLRQLLDRHPQARGVFPHLASVERCLHIRGVEALADMSAGALDRARGELLSIASPSEVQLLLELFAGPHRAPSAEPLAPSFQATAASVKPLPRIENLDVEEVEEEAYLTVLLEWSESGLHDGADMLPTQADSRSGELLPH